MHSSSNVVVSTSVVLRISQAAKNRPRYISLAAERGHLQHTSLNTLGRQALCQPSFQTCYHPTTPLAIGTEYHCKASLAQSTSSHNCNLACMFLCCEAGLAPKMAEPGRNMMEFTDSTRIKCILERTPGDQNTISVPSLRSAGLGVNKCNEDSFRRSMSAHGKRSATFLYPPIRN